MISESRLAEPNPALSLRPTRTRYWLIVFAITLAVIQYIDRVCISQAMPDIARDLRLTDAQKDEVYFAFGLTYAVCANPTVWLGTKIEGNSLLMRVPV